MTLCAPISRSYKVPDGVRKSGAESPSFIEPIGSRMDGLKQAFEAVRAKNKRPREAESDDDIYGGRQTPPPRASTSRAIPLTPSGPKRLRLTSPVPSPHKVHITPSKPLTVTQVNAPSPVDVTSSTSSAGSPSRGDTSDAELSDGGPENVARSSEDEDLQVPGPTPGTSNLGIRSRKGKERERRGKARGKVRR